jgi:hypothetical protein
MALEIKTLDTIIGDYVGEEDYELLNEIDPKIYTSDGLFMKKLQGVDRADILFFVKARKHADQYIQKNFKDKKIDPMFVTSLVLDEVTGNEGFDSIGDTSIREFFHIKINRRIDDIKEDFNSNKLDYFSDMITNDNTKLLFIEAESKGKSDFFLENIMNTAYENMLEGEPDVYTTTYFRKTDEKIVPYLEKISDQIRNGEYEIKDDISYITNIINEFSEKYNIKTEQIIKDIDDNSDLLSYPDDPYNLFFQEKIPKAPMKELSRKNKIEEINQKWLTLSIEKKQKYIKLAELNKERFIKGLKNFYNLK